MAAAALAAQRAVRRKAEMTQYLSEDVGGIDRGDDGHATATARAAQDDEVEDPPHQVGPSPVPGASPEDPGRSRAQR